MKSIRVFCTLLAALGLTAALLLLHIQVLMRSTDYLDSVVDRAGTARQLAQVLPKYAAEKLPDAPLAQSAFSSAFSPASSAELLKALNGSLVDVYAGRITNLSIDLTPQLAEVNRQGYSIPPGTALANPRIELGGLVPFLHGLKSAAIPSLLFALIASSLAIVFGGVHHVAKRLELIALITALFLAAAYGAAVGAPWLLDSLLTSSRMDAGITELIVGAIRVIANDTASFALRAAFVLLVITVIAAVATRFHGGAPNVRRRERRAKRTHAETDQQPPRL